MFENSFQLPSITMADIAWVCKEMQLPLNAFTGLDGKDPRADVLKRMDTIDIEACPGSGKTTLLVAKLAILANKWTDARSGICVLSHTNSARNEIAKRIGSCAAGNAVLRYPHFIGTIHSLANEFLGIPWLRSNGYLIKVVDTEFVQKMRWHKLPYKTRSYLEKRHLDPTCLSYDRSDFGGGLKTKLGEHTLTYKVLVKICEETSKEGFFCYDEMFVWSNQLLDIFPQTASTLRQRFPLVIMDEAQDNSELQSVFLNRLFFAGKRPSIRQRLGDSNQAIYKNSEEEQGAISDVFPNGIKLDLPHSFRFGQAIADLADPIAPIPQKIIGRGPLIENRCNTIFLFNDQSVLSVLPAYAAHLIKTFSPAQLAAGKFTAVAGVHASPHISKLPRSLIHYAPYYQSELAKQDASPTSFLGYLSLGRIAARETNISSKLVSEIATALLCLSQLSGGSTLRKSSNSHRQIKELLQADKKSYSAYIEFMRDLVICNGIVSSTNWINIFSPAAAKIAQAMSGFPATSGVCKKFLKWDLLKLPVDLPAVSFIESNFFSYPSIAPIVNIRLGSIHSVKGETHTATLVLDTYFHAHHLSELKPWLLGSLKGKGKQKVRMIGRLKLHYVAMTRPSHLLCLAMRRDALDSAEIAMLESRGWQVIYCEESVAADC